MSDIAIRIEGLDKRYPPSLHTKLPPSLFELWRPRRRTSRYGGVAPVSDNFRADLVQWVRGFVGKSGRSAERQSGNLPAEASSGAKAGATERQSDSNAIQHPTSRVADSPPPSTPSTGSGSSLRSDIQHPGSGITHHASRIQHHPTLREVHADHLNADPNYFWALRDINLEIKQGEVCPPRPHRRGRIADITRRREIAKKFDEIVAFAEIEKFIDTPVKVCASGITRRLALGTGFG